MKALAVLEADLDVSPLGTRSRLRDELPAGSGDVVLRRTVRRLQRCRRLSAICVAVPAEQMAQAVETLGGLDIRIEGHAAPRPPWLVPASTGGQVAAARKWSLDRWRGGLAGFAAMDEGTNPLLLEALARRDGHDAVVPVPAAATLIDPVLVDAVIDNLEKIRREMRLTFAPAPPGLAAPAFMTDLLVDACRAGWPLGRALAYRPDDPQRELLVSPCCYHAGPDIEQAIGRILADCGRGFDRIERFLRGFAGDPDALAVARWLREEDRFHVEPLPREVELELTTEDQLTRTTLRPRGPAVGPRGPMDLAVLDRLFAELAQSDDSLIVFGGFGEPLLHPAFEEIVRRARRAGVFGIAVRTNALGLEPRHIEALLAANVDVVSVLLDAHSAEVYRQVHQHDGYDRAVANIQSLLDTVAERRTPCPLIVPEMLKTRRAIPEMEAFYDDWIRKAGSAVIVGPPAYGGPFADLAVMNMAPPRRFPCFRLWSRLLVLADGRVTICDQDFRGEHAVGSLHDSSLADLWTGPRLTDLRRVHRSDDYEGTPFCAACREWHRP